MWLARPRLFGPSEEPCRERRTQSTTTKSCAWPRSSCQAAPPLSPKLKNVPQSDFSSSFSSEGLLKTSTPAFALLFFTLSLLNVSNLKSCSSLPLAYDSSQAPPPPNPHTVTECAKKKWPLANLIQSQKHRFLSTA